MIGFADDTNLIVYNNDVAANCKRLECAWVVYERWVMTRGMVFALEKSKLIHFTQMHTPPKQMIRLSGADVVSVESTRFFEVWLDQKLRWHKHLKIM